MALNASKRLHNFCCVKHLQVEVKLFRGYFVDVLGLVIGVW
jgi:hypothetical protein